MFKQIIRLILFYVPLVFMNGLSFIIFDNVDITGISVNFKQRKNKNKKEIEQNVLLNYLKNCYNQDNKGRK